MKGVHKEVGVVVNGRLRRDAIYVRRKFKETELLKVWEKVGTEHDHDILRTVN